MADLPGVDAKQSAVLEKQWIKRSLEVLRATLIRSRGKEIAGSPISEMRGREIEQLSVLIEKYR